MSRRLLVSLTAALIAAGTPTARAAPLDDTPPDPTIRPTPVIDAPQIVRFDEPVRDVSETNVVLRVAGSGADLPATVRCRNAADDQASCATGNVREVRLRPADPLTPGERYVLVVNPADATPLTDDAGNPAPTTRERFRASLEEQESSAAATYAWRTVEAVDAAGGSYRAERTAGARVTHRFTGPSVTWVTVRGPAMGEARVLIDGARVARVDNYAPERRFGVERTYDGLGAGAHAITVRVLGVGRGSDTWVAVDRFRSAAVATTWRWARVDDDAASDGSYARTTARGARVEFTFRGKGLDWYTAEGPEMGEVDVLLDGGFVENVHNGAPDTALGVRRSLAGLTDEVHTLALVSRGGGVVAVDRFVVRMPDFTMYRRLGAWVDLWDYALDPATAIADMDARGVRTLYIQTARYNTERAIAQGAGAWVEAAHAAGIEIVGWYLPAYDQHLDKDVRRTVAIADYTSPNGERFDSLAVDIEYKGETESLAEFNDGIRAHLRRVRAQVGNAYPVGAIVPSPVGMAIRPTSWTGFPWARIGRYSDVVLPMAYWSYRTTCPENPDHCPYGYAVENTHLAGDRTGLPVHLIGGVGDRVTKGEVTEFVDGALGVEPYGGSIYDYRTTKDGFWEPLARFNQL